MVISEGSADGDAWDGGEGEPSEPIASGRETSAREQASVARISAARGSKILPRLEVHRALKLPLTRDLIEFIATCTRFQNHRTFAKVTIIRPPCTGRNPAIHIKQDWAISGNPLAIILPGEM